MVLMLVFAFFLFFFFFCCLKYTQFNNLRIPQSFMDGWRPGEISENWHWLDWSDVNDPIGHADF